MKTVRVTASLLALFATLLFSPAVAIAQPKPSAIEGTVTDQEETPLRDVAITITREDDAKFQQKAETSRKGRFTARLNNGGGTYVVRLEKEGFDPYETPVEVEDGTAHEITFRMAPEGSANTFLAARAYNEGAQLYQAGNFDEALEKFHAALEADPDLPQPHIYLADLYRRTGELDKAARSIEIYLPTDATNPSAWRLAFDIARTREDEAGVTRAVENLAGTEIAESLAARTYNEGVEKSQGGDQDGALADFRLALRLAPGLSAVYNGMAALLLNQGSYAEAVEAVDKLLAANPEDIRGRRVRYLALSALGDTRADAALDAWAAGDPKSAADLLYTRGDEAFRQDRLDDAIAALTRVLTIDPKRARAHYTLGLAYTSAGDKAKAREHLERFLELAPDDSEAGTAQELLKGL